MLPTRGIYFAVSLWHNRLININRNARKTQLITRKGNLSCVFIRDQHLRVTAESETAWPVHPTFNWDRSDSYRKREYKVNIFSVRQNNSSPAVTLYRMWAGDLRGVRGVITGAELLILLSHTYTPNKRQNINPLMTQSPNMYRDQFCNAMQYKN